MFKIIEDRPTVAINQLTVDYPGCVVLLNTKGHSKMEGTLLALSDAVESSKEFSDYYLSLDDDPSYELITAGSYVDYTDWFKALESVGGI